MSLSDVYRCPSCGFDVADIDYATMEGNVCPKFGKTMLIEFVILDSKSIRAEKRPRL